MKSSFFSGGGGGGGLGSNHLNGGGGLVVVWQWMNDEGDWSVYEAPVSNYIEDCYSSSRGGVVRLADADQNLANLTVDIGQMVQKSVHGSERPVRRELYDSSSAFAHGAIWQWGRERTHRNVRQYVWHAYSVDAANLLEAACCNGSRGTVDLDVNPINEPYVVDLNTMQQFNKTSGFSRPVQRLRASVSYRTVSNVRQAWHQDSWLASGFTGNSAFTGFGSSTQSPFNSSAPVSSSSSMFGNGSTLASNGLTFNLSNNSSSFGIKPGTGAFGSPSAPSFSFSSPISVSQPSFNSPSPASTQGLTSQRIKKVRTLRQNLTPGFGSNIGTAPSPGFSFGIQPSSSGWSNGNGPALNSSSQSATSSNWTSNANMPFMNPVQGIASGQWPLNSSGYPSSHSLGGSSSAFGSWRNISSPSNSGNNVAPSLSFGSSRPFQQSAVSSGSSASNSGSSSSYFSSAFSSIISGFSNMMLIPYRYITTGGNSNLSGSSNDSNIPAQPMDVVTQSTSKSGARSIGSTNQTTKRRKLVGEDQIVQDDLSFIQKLTARDVLGKYIKEVPKPPQNEDCCICCDSLREVSGYGQGDSSTVVQLNKCSHMFHLECLSALYDSSSKNGSVQCPNCKTIYGTKYGNCPNGLMKYSIRNNELPGFPGCSTFEIHYNIFPGHQSDVHPNPGRPYKIRGFPRICYLPNNQEGQKVLELLIVAWKRRLTFTIGTSVTTGEPDVVVWNEIHHKTEMTNAHGHGYPDPNYLGNVLAELAAQGVTDDDSL